MSLYDHIDASPLLSAHVSEQCVDKEHHAPHLHALLDGRPKVVGERILEILVFVPIGRQFHADGTSQEHAAGDGEGPPGLGG